MENIKKINKELEKLCNHDETDVYGMIMDFRDGLQNYIRDWNTTVKQLKSKENQILFS